MSSDRRVALLAGCQELLVELMKKIKSLVLEKVFHRKGRKAKEILAMYRHWTDVVANSGLLV
jgi:hypothetical protein